MGALDDLRAPLVRFLQEASRFGPLHLLCWSDKIVQQALGHAPAFPLPERLYFLQSLRYVRSVEILDTLPAPHTLPGPSRFAGWVVDETSDRPEKRTFCHQNGLGYHVVPNSDITGFPLEALSAPASSRKLVMVTGSFDWLHTGHIRFFEEVSTYGSLVVVVGHDANLRLLKGPGHPLIPQDERLYMVHSIRYVSQALLSSGHGWLDAGPELERLRPDIYAVNEDGDKPEKHAYCQSHGIEYLVLKRIPKEGLPRRSSTDLRGF